MKRRRAATDVLRPDDAGRVVELERVAQDASALADAMRGLNRAAPDDVLGAILVGAAAIVSASRTCFYVHDASRDAMVAANGACREMPMDHPAGRAYTERLAVLRNEPSPATLAAPVTVGGEIAGVLVATAEGKRYGDRELRLLESFAAEAAVAMERARALQQERLLVERLAEVDRAKSDFVAAVSHELKTPLTSLLGYASILDKRLDALSQDRRREFFGIIQRQGERILKLIGDLLESSRMESGLAKVRREHVDIRALVTDVVAEMTPVAKEHVIDLSLPKRDPGLWADPAALEHVLTNLLDNAIKYSPKGTTVRIAVETKGLEIRLSVADRGRGISAEELPFIFERFRQGDEVDRTHHSVGLGLFIVRSLVEAQGGTVSCVSERGKGSTFTVAFPRRAADRAPAPKRKRANGEPEGSVDAQTLRAIAESREAGEKS